jgi:Rps23 Pro-64 3,4-dihydroxylase Tpa1-like proline 4-hydroxylase
MQVSALKEKYQNNQPFPHIVIDDAFDLELIKNIEQEIIAFTNWDGEKQFFGSQKKRHCGTFSKLPPATRLLIEHLNGPAFLETLENLTGIAGLIPDPYLFGGGVHSISRGGFLKIHADFNWHQKLQLHRRLNLLLYLNSGWDEAWGGLLELWDAGMQSKRLEIAPIINRLVVFNTTDFSYHGHPEPLNCPEQRTRNSIALYYYSSSRPEHEIRRGKSVQTDYQPRIPGEF